MASFPTSYIPTTTAAATRSVDVASISGSNFSGWYRQDEGTMFAEFRDSSGTQNEFSFTISDNTVNHRISIFTSSSTTLNSRLISGGSSFNPGNLSFIASSVVRACISAKVGTSEAITACNGNLSTAGSPSSMPSVDRMYVGLNQAGGEPINGTIRRLTYYPARLSAANLRALTQ